MDRVRRRFIQGLAPAAVAAALPGALRASALAAASREGQDPSSGGGALERSPGKGFAMTPQELEWKALRIQALLEEETLQVHGLVPMFVRASDYRLPTAEDYAGAYRHRHLHGKTEAELGLPPMHVWRAWEDTAADTGFYLAALSWQYRCTGDSLALRRCRRTLRALKTIYDLGAQAMEPGFLCKPYGGKASNQTSPDQLQCVSSGLDAYRQIAGGHDAVLIGKMFRGFADFEIRHDYYHPGTYFAVRLKPRYRLWGPDWQPGTKPWSIGIIYLTVMYHAWRGSGDPEYLRQIERWYAGCGLDNLPSGGQGRSYRELYLPSLLMEIDPWRHRIWRATMLGTFRNVRGSIQADGTILQNGRWGPGPYRSGRSAIYARGMVSAQRWFPEEPLAETARHILEALDLSTFRFIMPPAEGESLAPEWKVETELIDHDSLTAWLWTYWEGRCHGYW